VSAKVAGRIERLRADEGARVAAGDTIAMIDASDYELQRNAAQAAVARAQAQLAMMISGARDEDIEQARSRVREAAATATLTSTNLSRMESLSESGSATQQQLDEAVASAERAAAARASAEEALAKLLRGNRKEEIRMAQAQVDQALAELGLAERSVAECSVTSPLSGTVATKVAEAGEIVGVGSPIVSVTDLGDAWLSIYIAENRLAGVTVGDSAYVMVDGDAQAYPGVVSFISPEAEFTPRDVQTPDERAKLVYRVKIALENPDGTFKPGMPADGYIDSRP
jgi:HlyD family secretion protein